MECGTRQINKLHVKCGQGSRTHLEKISFHRRHPPLLLCDSTSASKQNKRLTCVTQSNFGERIKVWIFPLFSLQRFKKFLYDWFTCELSINYRCISFINYRFFHQVYDTHDRILSIRMPLLAVFIRKKGNFMDVCVIYVDSLVCAGEGCDEKKDPKIPPNILIPIEAISNIQKRTIPYANTFACPFSCRNLLLSSPVRSQAEGEVIHSLVSRGK